ncbi:MAG: hypothetical protein LBJ60_03775 [Tannerellaceae bacterium]|nr:hypothetical protein [Tannerellaceae bacterium]
MENPSLLTKDTLLRLKRLTEDYPYFHTAKVLYLKNLAVLNAVNFASELERMAIYVSDRKKLFTLIEGTQYGLTDWLKKAEPEKEDDSFSRIDSFLSSHNQLGSVISSDPSILFRPSASSDYLYWTTAKEPEESAADTNSPKLQHHELIDSFLKEDRQRAPGKALQLDADTLNHTEEMEKKKEEAPLKDDDSYFTETLARIYIKQKRYEKALQIIKNLSLKYPEKNVYFADQIRFLEKLIINAKK